MAYWTWNEQKKYFKVPKCLVLTVAVGASVPLVTAEQLPENLPVSIQVDWGRGQRENFFRQLTPCPEHRVAKGTAVWQSLTRPSSHGSHVTTWAFRLTRLGREGRSIFGVHFA